MFAGAQVPHTVAAMLRAVLLLSVLLWAGATSQAANPPARRYERVEIAPTRTSIYVGIVSMTLPPMIRSGTRYSAAYVANVFPYFFYDEKGQLYVDITDAQLDDLAHGRPIEFSGLAIRDDGVERRITGKATPTDADSGKIKVRVFVSKRIDLIFNTTYRFAGAAGSPK